MVGAGHGERLVEELDGVVVRRTDRYRCACEQAKPRGNGGKVRIAHGGNVDRGFGLSIRTDCRFYEVHHHPVRHVTVGRKTARWADRAGQPIDLF